MYMMVHVLHVCMITCNRMYMCTTCMYVCHVYMYVYTCVHVYMLYVYVCMYVPHLTLRRKPQTRTPGPSISFELPANPFD